MESVKSSYTSGHCDNLIFKSDLLILLMDFSYAVILAFPLPMNFEIIYNAIHAPGLTQHSKSVLCNQVQV